MSATPSAKEKILPFHKTAEHNDHENDLESDNMEPEHDRLRDVEKNLQATREQMVTGFGDVKATIAKTETAIVRYVASVKEAMAKTETAIVKEIGDIQKTSSNRTFLAMAIILAAITLAVTVLIAMLRP